MTTTEMLASMKRPHLAACATFLFMLAGVVQAQERRPDPVRLQGHVEQGQHIATATDRNSGNVLRAGCTQGMLGLNVTYGKDSPISGDVAFIFQTKGGDIVATGVSLHHKGVAATRAGEANHTNLAKAFQEIVSLGAKETMVVRINLVDGARSSNIGQFDISGSGSTRAMRPVLQECGLT
ncbi:hypothetical protein [Devosia faecipullorum]|uniref:hypothetical protein n=1 Tax=Devosia faecipullorum TaxID=2755039 RepID=UPI00187B8002|nr:hypothetical protein [Devosia faecipullorum]MBE7731467.1 hypothetical protein [Devosia faecipullorum]